MKKYDYTKSNLAQKYSLLTERYYIEVKKEDLKEGCWDEERQHPTMECIREDGTLKDECRKMSLEPNAASVVPEETGQGPGSTTSMQGYAGPEGGDSLEETDSPANDHRELLVQHLMNAKECAGNIMAGGMLNEETHPKMEAVMETLHHLEELVRECNF